MDLNAYRNKKETGDDFEAILAILQETLRGFAFAQSICYTALQKGYTAEWVEGELAKANSYTEDLN